jgi:hypothetical protein
MDVPDFWKPHYINRENRFVSKGEMYMLNGPIICPRHPFSGFGGQMFNIKSNNSNQMSNNLTHVGTIPESIRHLFPDNAEVTAQWD